MIASQRHLDGKQLAEDLRKRIGELWNKICPNPKEDVENVMKEVRRAVINKLEKPIDKGDSKKS